MFGGCVSDEEMNESCKFGSKLASPFGGCLEYLVLQAYNIIMWILNRDIP
jgi:hypothetical protein